MILLLDKPEPLQSLLYDYRDLAEVVRKNPERFAFLGGGGTLNPMIQEAVRSGNVTADMQREFEAKADEILRAGAAGFGEMTALHFSLSSNHPYIAAPPDHPLFLLLADIAAREGVPIDLHNGVSTKLRELAYSDQATTQRRTTCELKPFGCAQGRPGT